MSKINEILNYMIDERLGYVTLDTSTVVMIDNQFEVLKKEVSVIKDTLKRSLDFIEETEEDYGTHMVVCNDYENCTCGAKRWIDGKFEFINLAEKLCNDKA